MSDDELQHIRRKTRQLRSEKLSDRIKKDITAYRNAVLDIVQTPRDITSSAVKLGLGEDMIDQAIANLQAAKINSGEVKREIISRAYHLAEAAMSVSGTTEDIANLMQMILSERVFLELQAETLVSILRATPGQRMAEARELLKKIDSSKYVELFGE